MPRLYSLFSPLLLVAELHAAGAMSNPDCATLDLQLSQLESETLIQQTGFYDDPANGAVLWGSLFWAPALAYYGYTGLQGYREGMRIEQADSRIAALRRLKAERRCYER